MNQDVKEVVVAQSRYCPRIRLEGLSKTTKTSVRVEGIPAATRTKHLSNTSLYHYRYTILH
jgi:hypothetical protein